MKARFAAAVAAVMMALNVTGCASDPVVRTTQNTNVNAEVDLGDPDEVIRDGLETMFTWIPAEDDSPADAYERASDYLSQELADQVGTVPVPGPGTNWDTWRTSNAMIEASAFLLADETPPNSSTERHRVAVVVQNATVNGSLIDEIQRTAYVTAGLTDGAWRITKMQFSS